MVPVRAADGPANGGEFFETKIRPLLVDHCYKCHGGDKKKGNLQLTSRDNVLKGGDNGPAIVPGQPEKSLLIKAIGYTDESLQMPPRSKLAAAHIADLTTWVKMGAPWPEHHQTGTQSVAGSLDLQERRKHWAWQPVRQPTLPAVQQRDWPRSPIDDFILARLEAQGLTPARPADRRTLLRRVTYDLIGLPPTSAAIEAVLADSSDDAFARVVDRLLASEQYGERWARHWLDLVRFAETCGHEYDPELPYAYRYRDYVIRAFNDDVPYNQFVREQIAGDLLPNPRRHPTEHSNESILGTAFWFLHEAKHSPVDIKADEAERIDNQIDVFAKTFLGLTVSCARCHDHKFDAISTNDYYALAGYLESSRYQEAFIDAADRSRALCRALQEAGDRCRTLAVPLTIDALRGRVAHLAEDLLANRIPLHNLSGNHPFYPWSALTSAAANARAPSLALRKQLLLQQLHEQASPTKACDVLEAFAGHRLGTWTSTGAAFRTATAPALEVFLRPEQPFSVRWVFGPDGIHSGYVSNRQQGVLRSQTFVLTRKKILYRVAGKQAQVRLIIDGYQHIQDPIYGGLKFAVQNGDRFTWHVQDVSMWLGQRAYIELIDDGPGFFAVDKILLSDENPPVDPPNGLLLQRLAETRLASAEDFARAYQQLFLEILDQWRSGTLAAQRDCRERVALLNFLLENEAFTSSSRSVPDERAGQLTALQEQFQRLEARLPAPCRALAMADGTAWNEHVFIRGNPKALGAEVPRRFLMALDGERHQPPRTGSGRLQLAEQVVAPANPLTARVFVNRVWQHHFGEGIVRSVDNFGVLGERPSHPELLDYLAQQFIQDGWSLKKLHRLLLLSSTYQMSSKADEQTDARDPQNRLWHRMPIHRLEAEAIRDAILAISGRLEPALYGPSVPPYLTEHMVGRGRPAQSGPLDGDGRRSIYLGVHRNFLSPLFLAFDFPIPFTTIGRRSVSNVPAQALALMNNPFVVQQAERWAQRILSEPGLSAAERIRRMYVAAFARPPTATELAEALAFLREQSTGYGHTDDPLAWRDLAHVLFNVKEFIFLD
jgi:hypothetical protein